MSLSSEFAKSYRRLFDEKSRAEGLNFTPKETDVIVLTFPKCGTHWAFQICNMLISEGDMSVPEEQYLLELAQSLGFEIDVGQTYSPRLFMTHFRADLVKPTGKYVNVLRDPKDATISLYKMQLGLFQATEADYPLPEFCKNFLDPEQVADLETITQHFFHSVEMYKKYPDNFCIVYYEDLQENPKDEIQRIAKFMGVSTDETNIERAYKMSTFEFMAANKKKFDSPRLLKFARSILTPKVLEYMGRQKEISAIFVNKGKVGGGKKLPEFAVKVLEAEWKKYMETNHGFKDYQDMRTKLR